MSLFNIILGLKDIPLLGRKLVHNSANFLLLLISEEVLYGSKNINLSN
jgi:hypothetical protein